MRIGIDASGIFGWRGPSRNTINLIRHLIESDHKNHYFLFVPKEPDQQFQRTDKYDWVLVEKKKYIPWLNFSLPIASSLHKIDLMIFPNSSFWILKSAKSIIFTRTSDIMPFSDGLIERANVFFRRHLLGRIADKVIANSHFNSSQISLTCKVSEEKISVIYNGIDPVFQPQNGGTSNGYGSYILYVGGTTRDKNLFRLLKAHELILRKGLDFNLVIVGGVYTSYYDIPLNDLLGKDLSSKNKIIIHGIEKNTEILATLYRNARLVVFPSLVESFGMISVEAMACGCPLVASRAPAIPEIAGDAAEYFDPYDIDEMASKIEAVLTDEHLRSSLIKRGYERVKRYDWNCSVRQLLTIIEEIGQRKRTS